MLPETWRQYSAESQTMGNAEPSKCAAHHLRFCAEDTTWPWAGKLQKLGMQPICMVDQGSRRHQKGRCCKGRGSDAANLLPGRVTFSKLWSWLKVSSAAASQAPSHWARLDRCQVCLTRTCCSAGCGAGMACTCSFANRNSIQPCAPSCIRKHIAGLRTIALGTTARGPFCAIGPNIACQSTCAQLRCHVKAWPREARLH